MHEKISQQTMAPNLHGKKMHTHQDDEIKHVFTPIEQSYNSNLKNICFGQALERKREPRQIEMD
jgi:hypothetical protein